MSAGMRCAAISNASLTKVSTLASRVVLADDYDRQRVTAIGRWRVRCRNLPEANFNHELRLQVH